MSTCGVIMKYLSPFIKLEFLQQDLDWCQNANAISIRVCGILESALDSNVTVKKGC